MKRLLSIVFVFSVTSPSAQSQETAASSLPPAPLTALRLGEEEAVVRALANNPTLRAFRRQRAVAEGEIVSATALANPALALEALHLQSESQLGWGATLKWVPPQPVEWAARRSQSRSHLDEIRYEIAEQEWLLTTQVRTTYATLVELGAQERLLESALALRRRIVALVERQVQRGQATRLELNLAEQSVLHAQHDLDELELRRTKAQASFHSQLGLLSAEPVTLREEAPAQIGLATLPEPAALAERAVAMRPTIKAAYARILQRDQAVRIEKSRRFPWLSLSGRYRYNNYNASALRHDVVLGVELSLPMFHLQPGPLLVAQAQREQEQAVVDAQVQALLQSIYAACNELKVRAKILHRYQQGVLPMLAEHERLMRLALDGGQIDLLALLSSEESVLRGQREHSEARLFYRQVLLNLEAAVGFPLQRVGP